MTMTLNGSGTGTVGVPNSATAQNSTSGTAINFTGIPAGIKRITVMFNGVSTNGTSVKQVQIGSGSVTTTGYNSTGVSISTTAVVSSLTSGFIVYDASASSTLSGHLILTNVSGNVWVGSHAMKSATNLVNTGGGDVTLGGTLDRVRITTVNGTDTFDAGSINILYE